MAERILVIEADLGQEIEKLLLKAYPQRLHKLCQSPGKFAFVYVVVCISIHVVLALIFGGFSGTEDVQDITEDPLYLPVIVVLTVIVYHYCLLPRLVGRAFAELQHNQVFVFNTIKVDSKTSNAFSAKWVLILPLGLTLGIGAILILWLLVFIPGDLTYWSVIHPITFLVAGSTYMIAWWALVSLIANLTLTIRLINAIFAHNRIKVHRLYPDQSGGFNPMGRFSLRISVIALVYGAFLVAAAINSTFNTGIIEEDYLLFFQIPIYLVVVPTLFYWPLRSAHRAMVQFRDDLIRETSQRYLDEHLKAHNAATNDAEKLEARLKYMDALKKLQEHEQTYPVWPFNMRIRLTVVANTLVPVIPTVIGLALEKFAL
jgi:hypothetical protein